MDRRRLLRDGTIGLATLGFGPLAGIARAAERIGAAERAIVPIRATPDRIFRTTVCLRPFRAAGPRIAVEEVGRKRVVHHYGHGGSGWSLSWGSAAVAVPLALEGGAREIAVIGAGAIGLTTAITAQRMGAKVAIYAKERFPLVRSARATGTWSPDSRIAMTNDVDPGFPARWEAMARASLATHQSYLGAAGNPVEYSDRYGLFDAAPEGHIAARAAATQSPPRADGNAFLHLEERLADVTPRPVALPPGSHPFATPWAAVSSSIAFNIADLSRQLEAEFLLAGGRFVPAEFHAPADLGRLREKVIVNCTGYGARALFRDESIVPVRGQIAWLIPQEGAVYGLYRDGLSILARRDGIVVQDVGPDDWFGYADANEAPDRAAAAASVARLATFFAAPPAI